MDEIFERVVVLTASLLSSARTSIWIEGDDGWATPRKLHGHSDVECAELDGRRFQPALDATEPFLLAPDEMLEIWSERNVPGASYAIAPLSVGGRWGCIVATLPADMDFGERELRLLGGLAHQAKLAIANVSNFEGLERTFVSTVEALANALEANDEYTSSHARWITDLSLRVGRELGLGDPCLKRLELGALLHDIGKIGIPSTVLSKPGRLTADERVLMETHPELGERIIAPIDRLQEVRTIVRHCHERWDGRGYPDGLAGEEIPLESRIIFVCDAYHAMTTDRPYRKRLSHPQAVRRLREAAGTQFDPSVVELAVRVLSELRAAI
jgi:HD-GYP domain-containing protein (c-di-GMP phosphodiesterase class II)